MTDLSKIEMIRDHCDSMSSHEIREYAIDVEIEIAALREALEHIKTHQMISAGDMAPMSAIYQMASKALEATK